MAKISLAVVTFNNAELIQGCLSSILAQSEQVQVYIVDNASEDKTVNVLKTLPGIDRVRLIENQTNVGFGAGHNQVIACVDSEYHVLCNPDIVVNPDTLNILADYMERHPDIGLVCPRFNYNDGRLQANNHRLPTVFDLALRRLAPKSLKKCLEKRMNRYLMLDVGYELSCDVPFVSGAFMFCRTAVLRQVGGFDTRYFLYFEDVDLCRKVQLAGFRTAYCADASVMHLWQRAAYKSWRMTCVMLISALKYFNKWGYQFF